MNGHWFCKPPNVARGQPQNPPKSVHPFTQRAGHTLPCFACFNWLFLSWQAGWLYLPLKMCLSQCFILIQHHWESSRGFFGICFWLFLEQPVYLREKKKRQSVPHGNLSIQPFQQHLHEVAEGQEEQREGEHFQQAQWQPDPPIRMGGAPPQACGTGAASIQALLPREMVS